MTTQTLKINLDSMSKLNDRVVEIEKYVEIHANLLNKHAEMSGKNLETIYQRFDTNDKLLDLFTQSIESRNFSRDFISMLLRG